MANGDPAGHTVHGKWTRQIAFENSPIHFLETVYFSRNDSELLAKSMPSPILALGLRRKWAKLQGRRLFSPRLLFPANREGLTLEEIAWINDRQAKIGGDSCETKKISRYTSVEGEDNSESDKDYKPEEDTDEEDSSYSDSADAASQDSSSSRSLTPERPRKPPDSETREASVTSNGKTRGLRVKQERRHIRDTSDTAIKNIEATSREQGNSQNRNNGQKCGCKRKYQDMASDENGKTFDGGDAESAE
ncbi:hypothetical protein BDZ97DRAFT_1357781 [Flammula alnicola]|nr:hypothetical protein BDZ97DRAFT_1357781 [Flammula alnicola]